MPVMTVERNAAQGNEAGWFGLKDSLRKTRRISLIGFNINNSTDLINNNWTRFPPELIHVYSFPLQVSVRPTEQNPLAAVRLILPHY